MKNILFLVSFFVFLQIQTVFATTNKPSNTIFFNIKSIHNQKDTTIFDYENAEIKADMKNIRTLSSIAIILSTASVLTFGLSLVPATIIAMVAFSKFQKHKKMFESMNSEDENYYFFKSVKKRMLVALCLSMIPFIFLFLFYISDGDFVDGGIEIGRAHV